MFGCCNALFSSACGCGRRSSCGGGFPPTPVFPPSPPVTPTSPACLRGMQLSLVGSSAETIPNGVAVAFDAVNSNNTLGVVYQPNGGSITIARAGTYLVNWWVATENGQTAESLAFATALNGSDVQTSYADIGGQIVGTAIVNVTTVPSTLSVVNRSGATVTYATAAGQAGLTLAQFA